MRSQGLTLLCCCCSLTPHHTTSPASCCYSISLQHLLLEIVRQFQDLSHALPSPSSFSNPPCAPALLPRSSVVTHVFTFECLPACPLALTGAVVTTDPCPSADSCGLDAAKVLCRSTLAALPYLLESISPRTSASLHMHLYSLKCRRGTAAKFRSLPSQSPPPLPPPPPPPELLPPPGGRLRFPCVCAFENSSGSATQNPKRFSPGRKRGTNMCSGFILPHLAFSGLIAFRRPLSFLGKARPQPAAAPSRAALDPVTDASRGAPTAREKPTRPLLPSTVHAPAVAATSPAPPPPSSKFKPTRTAAEPPSLLVRGRGTSGSPARRPITRVRTSDRGAATAGHQPTTGSASPYRQDTIISRS
ncbi:hypothetical protein PVAP13_1NG443819 [Panicum virgatum]|uniref:Uncharacterized protein n=1 Tax=Panicum virgatum TaxID=38727 RepID=A0A8T0X392_PANVG|nr:hypothetical protein PVAP13_1NG443819 [Panicum virgatum]